MIKEVVSTGSASEAMRKAALAFPAPSGEGKLVVFVYASSIRLQVSDEDVILPVQARESGGGSE